MDLKKEMESLGHDIFKDGVKWFSWCIVEDTLHKAKEELIELLVNSKEGFNKKKARDIVNSVLEITKENKE